MFDFTQTVKGGGLPCGGLTCNQTDASPVMLSGEGLVGSHREPSRMVWMTGPGGDVTSWDPVRQALCPSLLCPPGPVRSSSTNREGDRSRMAALLTTTQPIIVAGVDAHKDTHHAVVLDGNGVRLADRKFPATLAGYQDLLDWIASFGIPQSCRYRINRLVRERSVGSSSTTLPDELTFRAASQCRRMVVSLSLA